MNHVNKLQTMASKETSIDLLQKDKETLVSDTSFPTEVKGCETSSHRKIITVFCR